MGREAKRASPDGLPVARVVLVDDHPVYRLALAAMLDRRTDLELAGEAGDGPSAVEAIRRLRPDVAVVDLGLPGFGGFGVLEQLVGENCPARVLILSGFGDDPLIHRAFRAGAAGYLTKDASGEAICEAIAAVARGETVFDPKLVTSTGAGLGQRTEQPSEA